MYLNNFLSKDQAATENLAYFSKTVFPEFSLKNEGTLVPSI